MVQQSDIDMVETDTLFWLYKMSPHRDLDREERKPIFLRDAPVRGDAA